MSRPLASTSLPIDDRTAEAAPTELYGLDHGYMDNAFLDYYRCPSRCAGFGVKGELSAEEGYFTFRGATCFGRSRGAGSRYFGNGLGDVAGEVEYCQNGGVRLPFDLSEVVANLRRERYRLKLDHYAERLTATSAVRAAYYFLRPVLPIPVRRPLQKLRLLGWQSIAFPRWPVDFTVDTLMQVAMAEALASQNTGKIPFVWFWPEGAPSGAMLTHDVESRTGRDFCDQLMDLDDGYGLKSAFQIVPEERYGKVRGLCASVRRRGFEVNVHDLNHDGRLFHSHQQFLERVARINECGRELESRGFRSAAMYRRQDWYSALEFSYDMSVPSVAHLEAQRGGCCTVMPYFVEHVLELPLTTIQDYSLFHILGDYSIAQWKTQIDLIVSQNGLVSLLTHPDYLIEKRAQAVYKDLLAHIRRLKDRGTVWFALPGEVDRWWRNRGQMQLVRAGDSWRIEGPDSHRARVAYAKLEGDRLVYEIDGRTVRPLAACR